MNFFLSSFQRPVLRGTIILGYTAGSSSNADVSDLVSASLNLCDSR